MCYDPYWCRDDVPCDPQYLWWFRSPSPSSMDPLLVLKFPRRRPRPRAVHTVVSERTKGVPISEQGGRDGTSVTYIVL